MLSAIHMLGVPLARWGLLAFMRGKSHGTTSTSSRGHDSCMLLLLMADLLAIVPGGMIIGIDKSTEETINDIMMSEAGWVILARRTLSENHRPPVLDCERVLESV